jgi:hypothetical protein
MNFPTDKKEGGNTSDIDRGSDKPTNTTLDNGDLNDPQKVFFKFIDSLSWPQGKSPFQHMLDSEVDTNESTAVKSRLRVVKTIYDQEFPDYSLNLNAISEVARTLFGSIENAWAKYQIHSNATEAEKRFHDSDMPPPPTGTLIENDVKEAEIIGDISYDPRFFLSSDLDFPATLPDTIKAQFLRIVEEKGWWEALALTYLSRQGCHAILYKKAPNVTGGYPFLLSSGLIQHISPEEDEDNSLLTRSPIFRGKEWNMVTDTKKIVKTLDEYALDLKGKNIQVPDIDLQKIQKNPIDNAELEESIINALGTSSVSEMIRLTCSEPNGWRNCYEGIKHFSKLQVLNGIPFSFGVAYEDLSNAFEVLGLLSGKPCQIVLSEHRIKPGEPKTCKNLMLNNNIHEAMQSHSWRIVGALLQKINQGKDISNLVTRYKQELNC